MALGVVGYGRLSRRGHRLGHSLGSHLQVDDDSYVQVGAILEKVARIPRQAAMLGYIESPGGHPHRDPANQWYASEDEWPGERYPPWAHGAGAAAAVPCTLCPSCALRASAP